MFDIMFGVILSPLKPTSAPSVESRTGAVAVVSRWLFGLGFRFAASIRFGLALFPVPAHRTGQAVFPHPALGKDSRFRPRKAGRPHGEANQAQLVMQGVVRKPFR